MNEGWRADCVSWKNKNKLWKRSKLYCQWWVCSIGQQMYAEYIFRTFQKKEEKEKKNKINSKRKQCWLKMVMLKLSFKLTILNCCVFLLFLVNCQSCWNVYFYKLACFFFPDCGKPIYFIYLFILFVPPFIALHGSATIFVAVLMILMVMFTAVYTRVVGMHHPWCWYMIHAWCDPGTYYIFWSSQTSTQ